MEAMRFEGQVAVVTGGAQGIGFGIARRLGGEGARLALLDKNGPLAGEAVRTLEQEGSEALALAADVTQQPAVEQAVAEVLKRFGRIDVLVTAAGITGQTNLKTHEVDPADFDRVLALNVRAMFLCIRSVLPAMLRANYVRFASTISRAVSVASPSGTFTARKQPASRLRS
jgi:NAD(P)-dependent dehydrogenase (short-subunit alcohol dehydrogenase family)